MLSEALRLAISHPNPGKYPVCAIACDRGGNILAVGYNSYAKTHPTQARHAAKANQPGKIYLHAEIAALVKAKGEVYSLSVARVTKEGASALAKPCPVCYLAIREANVRLLEWTQ